MSWPRTSHHKILTATVVANKTLTKLIVFQTYLAKKTLQDKFKVHVVDHSIRRRAIETTMPDPERKTKE